MKRRNSHFYDNEIIWQFTIAEISSCSSSFTPSFFRLRNCVTNERFVPLLTNKRKFSVYNFISQFSAIYFARISFVRATWKRRNHSSYFCRQRRRLGGFGKSRWEKEVLRRLRLFSCKRLLRSRPALYPLIHRKTKMLAKCFQCLRFEVQIIIHCRRVSVSLNINKQKVNVKKRRIRFGPE